MKRLIQLAFRTISAVTLILFLGLIGPEIFSQVTGRTDQHKSSNLRSVSQWKFLNRSSFNPSVNYAVVEQQDETVKDKTDIQSQEQETPAAREKRLIELISKVKTRMDSLQSELNELCLRTLQNRPRNPLVFGDPYYVDPKLREQVTKVRRQLLETQIEFENLVNEIENGQLR